MSLVRTTRTMARPGPRPPPERPIIVVDDLSIGWGDIVIQKNLSFEVKRGEVFAILGGSGSGKSTLLRFLIGLESPLAGAIPRRGQGRARSDGGASTVRRDVSGGSALWLAHGRRKCRASARRVDPLPEDAIAAIARAKLRLVGLEGAADKIPAELSGGMKKRAIARALALRA